MKKTLRILAVLTLLLFTLIPYPANIAQGSSPLSHLLITEVASTLASDDEWIEIYNPGAEVTLSTLIFFENETNHGVTAPGGQTLLDSNAVAIIANKADVFMSKNPGFTGVVLDSSWVSLKQEGEPLALKVNDTVVDSITYSATSAITETSERAAVENLWSSALPSPGQLSQVQQSLFANLEAVTQIPPPANEQTPSTEQTTAEQESPTEETLVAETTEQTSTPAVEPPPMQETPAAQPAAAAPAPQVVQQGVQNSAPVALIDIQSGQASGNEKVTINFDGRRSYDSNGDAIQFLWTFGDGTSSQSSNPGAHTFAHVGEYTVTLLVVDAGGLRGYAYQKVSVLPKAFTTPSTTTTTTKTTAVEAKTTAKSTTAIITPHAATKSTLPTDSTITINLSYEDARAFLQSYLLGSTTDNSGSHLVAANAGLTPTPLNGGRSSTLFINEILPSPPKDAEEWIEIGNSESVAQNLSGWLLADSSKAKKPYVFPAGTAIAPHGFILISSKVSKISLNNNADTIYLANPAGQLVDSLTYTSAKKSSSFARYANPTNSNEAPTWAWSTIPSPSKSNGALATVQGTVNSVQAHKTGETTTPSINLTDTEGETHDIFVAADDPDGTVTKSFFIPGTEVALAAYEDASGSEHLAEVKKISAEKTATQSANNAPNYLLYGVIGFLALLNMGVVGFLIYAHKQGGFTLFKKQQPRIPSELPPDEEDFL